jgi:hypothetical protein
VNQYCLDSSALIEAWTRYYPQDVMPGFWAKLDELCRKGRVCIADEVLRETEKQDDGLSDWLKTRGQIVVPPDDSVQQALRVVLAKYPGLIDVKRARSMGDPWVVATAIARGAVVVSQEYGGSITKPKIPFVCQQERIVHMNLLTLIRAENWRFA